MKKILSIILAMILVMLSVPSFADTEAETTLHLSMFDADQKETYWDVTYSDSFFTQPQDEYNHALGQLSVSMALCAWRDKRKEIPHKDDNIIDFLEQAGFSDIETPGYDQEPTSDSISNAIAQRTLPDGTTLIVVAVCGGCYKKEWASNLYVGDEERSAGFNNASQIVQERIRDYIDRYAITGEKCLWISGYSRAAAVSNITAADMTDSGLFARVYAYTFATPRTTRDPGDYTNIFNIVGRFDPVPMVPLPDWGYKRFGIDMYTPAQETNSDFISALNNAQDFLTSIDRGYFRNNPGMNDEIHTILVYLLDMLPDAATYYSTLYPVLCELWTDSSDENIPLVLIEAINTLINSGTIQGVDCKDFLEYLSQIGYQHTAGGNQEQVTTGGWDKNTVLSDNLMHEHVGISYLSWMLSTDDPNALFLDCTTYTRFIISGKVNIDVFDANGFCVGVTTSGNFLRTPVNEEETYYGDNQPYLYCYSENGNTVICIPGDNVYAIRLKAKDSDVNGVTYFGITYTTDSLNGAISEKSTLDVKKGQEYWITCDTTEEGAQIIGAADYTAEAIQEGSYSPRLLVALQQGNTFKMDIQTLVAIVLMAAIIAAILLLVCFILGLIRLIRHKKRHDIATVVFHAVTIILCFVLEEFCRFYVSGFPIAMSVLKGLASLTILLLGVKGIRRLNRKTDLFICGALLLNGVADVVINMNMQLGIVFYGISHILIAVGFLLNAKARWWQYVVFAVLFALCSASIIYYREFVSVNTVYALIYAALMCASVAASLKQRPAVIVSIVLFMTSDILLFRNMIVDMTITNHVISLGTYYLSMFILAASIWFGKEKEEDEEEAASVAKA